jgi:hypothetical protein
MENIRITNLRTGLAIAGSIRTAEWNPRMVQSAKRIEISPEEGKKWFESQLKQGFGLAEVVLGANVLDQGHFETFVTADKSAPPDFPRCPDVVGSKPALAKWLDEMASQGARSVVIEDDVERRADPNLESPAAFIGDRVLHWCSLGLTSGPKAAAAVNRGAFGYPLNAFVVSRTPEELGLFDQEHAPADLPEKVLSSLLAIIVSAFDNTSYAIWHK